MAPGDWSGDGLYDLIGVTPSGQMFQYTTDGHANFTAGGVGTQIGQGWQSLSPIF